MQWQSQYLSKYGTGTCAVTALSNLYSTNVSSSKDTVENKQTMNTKA